MKCSESRGEFLSGSGIRDPVPIRNSVRGRSSAAPRRPDWPERRAAGRARERMLHPGPGRRSKCGHRIHAIESGRSVRVQDASHRARLIRMVAALERPARRERGYSRQMPTGGRAPQADAIGINPLCTRIRLQPSDRGPHVLHVGRNRHRGCQAILDRRHRESVPGEIAFEVGAGGWRTTRPASSMEEHDDRNRPRTGAGGQIEVEQEIDAKARCPGRCR
jgi:hypothetical protein